MKNIPVKTLILASFFLLCSGWAGSPVYAQNESDSPIHEMPDPDKCSVEMMRIRDLAAALKQVSSEMSAHSATGGNRLGGQQMNRNDQDLKALKEKEYTLRKQMYMQEQQLEECMKQESPPNQ